MFLLTITRLILKVLNFTINLAIPLSPLLTFSKLNFLQRIPLIPNQLIFSALAVPLLLILKKASLFISQQVLEIQNAYLIRTQNNNNQKKLEHKEQHLKKYQNHLRQTEIFLAKQVEAHNQTKEKLRQEVMDYHQELVNDFILKKSKEGLEN